MKALEKFLKRFTRSPDVIIGSIENPYLLRWHLIRRNRFFNIYLHKLLRDDDDRALYDHPWGSCSIILKTGYLEHLPGGVRRRRNPGRITFRKAGQAHRIELLKPMFWWKDVKELEEPVPDWSLFITGRKIREWGFHCSKGWVHWKIFCSPHDTTTPEDGLLGRDCE